VKGLKSALIVYWSNAGNTEKVAFVIKDGLERGGEFYGREDLSTKGRLGDIREKPTAEDLAKIKKDPKQVAKSV